MFCGPFMELTSSWKDQVPGGITTLATLVLGMGATIFTMLEGLPQSEAIYASVVTGKTHAGRHERGSILAKSFTRLFYIPSLARKIQYLPSHMRTSFICRNDDWIR